MKLKSKQFGACFLALVLLFFSNRSLEAMAEPPFLEEKKIGVHTFYFQDSKRDHRPVIVEVWYPTLETGPYDESEKSIWEHPREIRDVVPIHKKHPLILMSHGHGGDRRDRSWLVQHLVDSGYIVASVEHHGNSWKNYSILLSLKFWERSKDISFAISQIIKSPFLRKNIDHRRIGFIGYSLGGMTGLTLAGARVHQVKQAVQKLQESMEEIEDEIIDQLDFKEAYADFYEKRIKAMVLLTPAAYVFSPESLQKIEMPIALVATEGDEVLPFKEHALKLIQHLNFKKLKILRNQVSHYVFLDRVTDVGKAFISKEIYSDQIQKDRIYIHREVGEFVCDFFNEHLY